MQSKPYKSYSHYLGLDQVLSASDFVGDDCDQLNFVISHQITELLAKLLLRYLTDYQAQANLQALLAAESVSRQMVGIWEIFEHLSVKEFLRFRKDLEGISGAESVQFQELERMMPACKEVCRAQKTGQARQTLSRIDNNIRKWKTAHLQITEKLIGRMSGTGGSAGASYLKRKEYESLFSHDDLNED